MCARRGDGRRVLIAPFPFRAAALAAAPSLPSLRLVTDMGAHISHEAA